MVYNRFMDLEEKETMTVISKLYLETSVVSMYYSDDDLYKRDLTQLFWKEVLPHFDTYISGFVIDEIEATEDPDLRKNLENLVRGFNILEITENTLKLAELYLSYRRLPRMDARHIAVASLGDMDFLVTWNLKHLYKRGTQEMVREINTRLRIPIPIIVTPEDFLEEEV